MVSKGYTYNNSKNSEYSTERTYSFSTYNYDRNYATYWISKVDYKNNNKLVSWTTYKISDYSAIKAQIKNLGFKFTHDQIKEGVSALFYKKGNLELSLYSQEITTREGKKI